jgi:uncharacterized protein (TIGR03435 family)
MRSKKFCAVKALFCLLSLADGAVAQSFEAAAIKVSNAPAGSSNWSSDEVTTTITNETLRGLIQDAFDVRSFSLSGPDWLDSLHFDINAKMQPGSTSAGRNLMMQALLKERFGLVVHHELKTIQGYALVIAKNGFKLKAVEDVGGHRSGSGNGKLSAQRMSMERFADRLARQLDQPVSDMTDLKGVFNIELTYQNPRNHDDSRPSIFTALQEQLGLKLEARKVPVDIVVVDHVERTPTEN